MTSDISVTRTRAPTGTLATILYDTVGHIVLFDRQQGRDRLDHFLVGLHPSPSPIRSGTLVPAVLKKAAHHLVERKLDQGIPANSSLSRSFRQAMILRFCDQALSRPWSEVQTKIEEMLRVHPEEALHIAEIMIKKSWRAATFFFSYSKSIQDSWARNSFHSLWALVDLPLKTFFEESEKWFEAHIGETEGETHFDFSQQDLLDFAEVIEVVATYGNLFAQKTVNEPRFFNVYWSSGRHHYLLSKKS